MTQGRPLLQGSMVALVTPMKANGDVDSANLDAFVDFHIEQGTDAIVAVGTSGESATLAVDEHLKVVEQVIKRVDKRIPVVAGTGANSTQEAVELTQEAKAIGADACLLVVPYYNKPTQEGVYQHYMTVADSVEIPQVLYNVPGRTITDMQDDVTLRLATHDNVVGIKDATGDMSRAKYLIDNAPNNFFIYSGDDITAFELMLLGGKGNISVTANIAPALMSQLCELAIAGNRSEAVSLQDRLMPLHEALFVESNPIPVKWAAFMMGLIPEGIRLPLTPLSDTHREPLREKLAALNLL